MTFALPRERAAEWMDDPDVDPAELERSLSDLRLVNRWLGGARVVVHHLARMIEPDASESTRILDVATGSADIPLRLVRWSRSRQVRLEIVATDAHPQVVRLARRHAAGTPDIRVETADALDLPYSDGSFDFAICSTALHHFAWDSAVRVLRELGRVAARGILVNDLRRAPLALAGARLLAATVWRRSLLTRHDGPISVRQAFTSAELCELGRAAGLDGARVYRHAPFRVALAFDRAGAG